MTKGIVIKGAKDTKIENCDFVNLDVAIEAENSENLQLSKNRLINSQRSEEEKER